MTTFIQCQKCGSCININTGGMYIECACGAIAVDGCDDGLFRVIGEYENWEYVNLSNKNE